MWGDDRPQRRWARLRAYDYAQAGLYAVTICTQHRSLLFGEIIESEMQLSEAGRMVFDEWNRLLDRFDHIELDAFIVMPNHLHGIIVIRESRRDDPCDRPVPRPPAPIRGGTGYRPAGTDEHTLSRVTQAFKSITTNRYAEGVRQSNWLPFERRLWQGSYYDHVIRDDRDLDRIRRYIIENPIRWMNDRENPMRMDRPNHRP